MTRLHKAILVVHALLGFGAAATSIGPLAGALVFALALVPMGYHALIVMVYLPREREQAERLAVAERANAVLRDEARELRAALRELQTDLEGERSLIRAALRPRRRP